MNHTNVYALFLDASKAFDRVHYGKLFKELCKRNLSPIVTRLLLYMYTHQKLQIRWGSKMSNQFNVMNGVKQGGVLSPILFAIYMDGMLKRVEDAGIGCFMNNNFVGSLAFADDVKLLCPTMSGLQVMANICEKYASEFNIKFNGSKSRLLLFKGRQCKGSNMHLYVSGTALQCVVSVADLGHNVSSNDQDSMVNAAKASFWRSFNSFMSDFGHIYSFLKSKLFKQYCCSFYGAPLWYLNGEGVKAICVAWRKALRMIHRVHPATHCDIIAAMAGQVPLLTCLKARFCKFYKKCVGHKNPTVQSAAAISMINPMSCAGRNFREVLKRESNVNMLYMDWNAKCEEMKDCVNVLREMIDVRDGYMECIFSHESIFNYSVSLTKEDIQCIIDDICLN